MLHQFFIFLVWLNFGRTAVNPFGSDDDDIDVKQLLATHIQVYGLVIVVAYRQTYIDN